MNTCQNCDYFDQWDGKCLQETLRDVRIAPHDDEKNDHQRAHGAMATLLELNFMEFAKDGRCPLHELTREALEEQAKDLAAAGP